MARWFIIALGAMWIFPLATMLYLFADSAWNRGYYEPMALVWATIISLIVIACAYLAEWLGKREEV